MSLPETKIPIQTTIRQLATLASAGVSQCILDCADHIEGDARRVLRNTEAEKAPVLVLSCTLRLDLRSGGLKVKMSGGSKFKVCCTEQMQLSFS